MRREIKTALGRLLHAGGLHRRMMHDKAVVLLFHRVDDRFPGDPITCSRREFADYCGFLRRHYDVVTLEQLLRDLRAGADVSGRVVITFDDGYRDNYEAAAPELERHGLPATFFIATELIGSTRVPWWDEKLPVPAEWMSWEQVRALGERFEIGAHTMNHVDLGEVDAEEAWREITGSRDRLAAELGRAPRYFSYPYGRPTQITERNRDLVRRAGFDCCLSAYGGAVSAGSDLFRIQRMPISPWYVSAAHAGFEMARVERDASARGPRQVERRTRGRSAGSEWEGFDRRLALR